MKNGSIVNQVNRVLLRHLKKKKNKKQIKKKKKKIIKCTEAVMNHFRPGLQEPHIDIDIDIDE